MGLSAYENPENDAKALLKPSPCQYMYLVQKVPADELLATGTGSTTGNNEAFISKRLEFLITY